MSMLNFAGLTRNASSNVFNAAATNIAGRVDTESTAATLRSSADNANYLNNLKASLAMSKAGPSYSAATAAEISRNANNV